jgi:hypothetical protein
MSAIEGSTVNVKTLMDGTLRLAVDIPPADAKDAFALFGAPGRGVALAALADGRGAKDGTQERETPPDPATPLPEPEKRRLRPRSPAQIAEAAQRWEGLGTYCRAAITIGQSPDFWEFANVENAREAEEWIKSQCGVTSRKELDLDAVSGLTFRTRVLDPYRAFLNPRGEDEGAAYET